MNEQTNSGQNLNTGAEPQSLLSHFRLPPRAEAALDSMIAGELELERLGLRGLVTGLGSGDSTDFIKGLQRLRQIIVTQFADGFEAGRETRFSLMLIWLALGAASASILWSVFIFLM